MFAITHLYSPTFDPTCPIPLRQFVSVTIQQGSAFLFEALDFVLHVVGEVVRRCFDSEDAKITDISPIHALCVTDNKGLVPHIRFLLRENDNS